MGHPEGLVPVKVTCNRCHRKVSGMESSLATTGFYKTRGTYWARYAKPGESCICDSCMQKDPGYKRDFPWIDSVASQAAHLAT